MIKVNYLDIPSSIQDSIELMLNPEYCKHRYKVLKDKQRNFRILNSQKIMNMLRNQASFFLQPVSNWLL